MALSREQARDVLVQRLYERSNDPQAEPEFEEEEIYDLVSGEIAPAIVHTILNDFFRNRLIRQTRAGPVMFEVTDSLLHQAEQRGTAPDRVVSLNDNEGGRAEAVTALDGVLVELDRSNDLGTVTEEEKDNLKKVVSAGRDLLIRSNFIKVQFVTATLLPTLNWMKSNFSAITVATLAGVAALAIGRLLGLG